MKRTVSAAWFMLSVLALASFDAAQPASDPNAAKTELHPWITAKGVLAPGQPMQ